MDPFRTERSRVLLRSSGEKPELLHLSVANGFPPETYLPFLEALNAALPFPADAFSVLPQALWKSPGPTDAYGSWTDGAGELCETFEQLGAPQGLIGIGHSFGALVTAMAAVREPARFRAMVWLDPTLLSRWRLLQIRLYRALHRLGFHPKVPVVERALRRRNLFGSPAEALEYFRGRKIFTEWDDRALAQYVEWGLKETDVGWVLAWDPAWEARTFATTEPAVWSHLRRLRRDLPILVVRGAASDVLAPAAIRRLRGLGLAIEVVEVPGCGHLFPQTAPAATAKIVAEWLGRVVDSQGRNGFK